MADNPRLLYHDPSSSGVEPDNDLGGDKIRDQSPATADLLDAFRQVLNRYLQSALGDDFDESDMDSLIEALGPDKLGTAATRDVQSDAYDTSSGTVMQPGAFGLGGPAQYTTDVNADTLSTSGFYYGKGENWAYGVSDNQHMIVVPSFTSRVTQIAWLYSHPAGWLIRSNDTGDFGPWQRPNAGDAQTVKGYEAWTMDNATANSNGQLVTSSPRLRVYDDRIERNEADDAEFERIGTGHYRITGTLGVASSPWDMFAPSDTNQNPLVYLDYTVDDDGTIDLHTYEPVANGPFVAAGDPRDIPDGRWVDIHLIEPEKSESDA